MNNFQQHFSFILNNQPPAIQPPAIQPPAIQPIQPPAVQPPAPFQLVQGKKPTSKQLIHQGFRYIQNGGHGEKKYWRCFYHKKDINNPVICKSILHTTDDTITRAPSSHNHPPDDASNTVKHVLSTIKALSSNSRLNPTAIVAQATRGLTPVEATLLPSKKSLKQVSQRAFKLDNPKKRSPATLAQIQHATYTC